MGKWVKARAEGFIDNLVFFGCIALIGAAVLALWAALTDLSGPLVVLIFLGSLAFLLQCATQGVALWHRWRRPKNPQQWEKTLRDWSIDQGWKFQDDANPDCHFRFNVEFAAGEGQTIAMTRTEPNFIRLSAAIAVGEDFQKAMARLGARSVAEVMTEVTLELLRFGVEVPVNDPTRVILSETLWCSERLDKYEFLQHVFFVRRAIKAVMLVYRAALWRFSPMTVDLTEPTQQSTPDMATSPPQPTA